MRAAVLVLITLLAAPLARGQAEAVVTAIEVGLFYVDLAKGLMITLLIALSVVKFALVAMFFMHLKFDHRLFTGLFGGGIVVAIVAFSVVLACFRFFQV